VGKRVGRGRLAGLAAFLITSAWFANQNTVVAAREINFPAPITGPIMLASAQSKPVNADLLATYIKDAVNVVGSPRNLSALIVDDVTGEVLYSQHSERAMIPASTMKLVTAIGVLRELGIETRFSTKVVQDGNTLTLVGGGDPTLVSKTPTNWRGKPPGVEQPPSLDQLADLVAQKLVGQTGPFLLNTDSSYFKSEKSAASWPSSFIKEGFVSPITGLTVDFGVDEAGHPYMSPKKFAGEYLAQALTSRGFETSLGEEAVAEKSSLEIGIVESAPVLDIVERMVTTSNNTMAEFLSHQVGKKYGDDSFANSAAIISKNIEEVGLDMSGVELHDGSGLSARNKITSQLLVEILRYAHTTNSTVWPLLSGLPIAGVSGTLEERFASHASGRGYVRAKTGTLSGVVSLAGSVTTESGNVLDFAIMANGVSSTSDTEKVVDSLIKRLSECGCS
jgi:D-alanyl-D-alanine carboxypeptidase/D-alanyl-D-alanine-endopeptidase (penicillin-binding protein 4)